MFFTGVGIFIGNCIGNGCICILLTIGLLCVGFKLFCCDWVEVESVRSILVTKKGTV